MLIRTTRRTRKITKTSMNWKIYVLLDLASWDDLFLLVCFCTYLLFTYGFDFLILREKTHMSQTLSVQVSPRWHAEMIAILLGKTCYECNLFLAKINEHCYKKTVDILQVWKKWIVSNIRTKKEESDIHFIHT